MERSPANRRRFLQGALASCLLPVHQAVHGGHGKHGAAAPQPVSYPRHVAMLENRYSYDWAVLRAALEKSEPAFGPFDLRQLDEPMSPPRVRQELALAQGRLDVLALGTSQALETQFLPIRIPIDKGLLGLRVLLVRAADLPRFAAVRTLRDLRALRAGLGKDWVDIPILRAAGIPVVEGSFENLCAMLMAGRFDFYSRGVDEAPHELAEHQARFPGMVLEPGLLLHYPLPRYLFVRRDADGQRLARRIRAGLETMVRDGALDALFRRYKGPDIARCGLDRRRLLTLVNPQMSPETPLARPELWYRPPSGK